MLLQMTKDGTPGVAQRETVQRIEAMRIVADRIAVHGIGALRIAVHPSAPNRMAVARVASHPSALWLVTAMLVAAAALTAIPPAASLWRPFLSFPPSPPLPSPLPSPPRTAK